MSNSPSYLVLLKISFVLFVCLFCGTLKTSRDGDGSRICLFLALIPTVSQWWERNEIERSLVCSMQYADLRLLCDCHDGCLTLHLRNPVVGMQSLADPADRHVFAMVHPSLKKSATSTYYTQWRSAEASEALHCICSLWFICLYGDRPLPRLSGHSVPTQPWQRPFNIWAYKPEAANTV